MSIDTVNDLAPRVQYTASAAQTSFDYPFPIFVDADLVVDVDGVAQALGTDYTVTGAGADAGGTIVFVAPMVGGEIVTIYRDIAIARDTDFQQNGPFRSAAINDELDKAFLIMQELESKVGRSIRFPQTAEITDAQTELSPVSNWFGKFLRVSATGILEAAEVLSSVVTLTQSVIGNLLNPQTTAEASLAIDPPSKWYPEGNVKRYGAVLNGSTDDTTAFQNAINVQAAGGNHVVFPAGNARITGLTFGSNVKIAGAGNKASYFTFATGTARTGLKAANTALFNDGAVFEDFGIVFANAADIGFDLTSVSRASLSRVRVWGDANQATRRGTGVLFDASVASCYANELRDCDIRDCTKNLHIRKGANSNHIHGGQILNGTDCVYQEGTGGTDRTDNITFHGTRIETSYGDCIHLSGDVWGWGFFGCRIEAYQAGSVCVRVVGGDASLPPTLLLGNTITASSGATDYSIGSMTGRLLIWGQDANQYQSGGAYYLGQKTLSVGNPSAAGNAVVDTASSDATANLELRPKGSGLVQLGSDALGGVIGGRFLLIDGIAAPTTVGGAAQIYVDTADGDLKVKFGDGTVKTIVVDT